MSEPLPLHELIDDPSISGDVALLRQINPKPQSNNIDWATIDADGKPKVRSAAFQRASRQFAEREGYPQQTLSLYLESVVVQQHGSVQGWLEAVGRQDYGVVRITAQLVRHEGVMAIQRDDHRGYLGHCAAWAIESGSKARADEPVLAARSEWVVVPER